MATVLHGSSRPSSAFHRANIGDTEVLLRWRSP